jgi:hypothetical protein
MIIFYTQYKAVPLPESEEFEVCGGAYINCWLKAQSEQEASNVACALLRDRGWKVVSVEEECRQVTASAYTEDAEGREYYDEAVTDGECYVFHQWPVDPQEDDDVHWSRDARPLYLSDMPCPPDRRTGWTLIS